MIRMQGRLTFGLILAALIVGYVGDLAKSAQAADGNPYYISIGVNTEHRENAVDRAGPYTIFHQGIGESAAIGRHLSRIFDIEVEANNFNNSDSKEVVPAIPAATPTLGVLHSGDNAWGNITLQSYMFNVVANVPIKKVPKLKPFVAAGLGVYQSQVNGLSSPALDSTAFGNLAQTYFPGASGAAPFVLNTTSDWQTAYQFKVGLAYKVDEHSNVFIDWRRFLGSRFELQSNNPLITGGTGQLHVSGPRVSAFELGVKIGL